MLRIILPSLVILPISFLVALWTSPPIIDRKIDVAFTELALIHQALALYSKDHGRLPRNEGHLHELARGPSPLVERLPNDPWGHQYVYQLSPNEQTYTLHSVGRNGLDEAGVGDDVTNRQKLYSCSEYLLNCPTSFAEVVHYSSLACTLASLLALLSSPFVMLWREARSDA